MTEIKSKIFSTKKRSLIKLSFFYLFSGEEARVFFFLNQARQVHTILVTVFLIKCLTRGLCGPSSIARSPRVFAPSRFFLIFQSNKLTSSSCLVRLVFDYVFGSMKGIQQEVGGGVWEALGVTVLRWAGLVFYSSYSFMPCFGLLIDQCLHHLFAFVLIPRINHNHIPTR